MRGLQNKLKIFAIALALLAGCSDTDVPGAKSTTGRPPLAAEIPDPDETVRGADEPAVVTLDLGAQLHDRRLAKNDDLPDSVIVPATNLNGVPVATALQAVLTGTDVSLSWNTKAFADRLVTVSNLSGPLPRVVEKICNSAKVFCDYRHGLLEIKDKETFIIELPAVLAKAGATSASNSMADAVQELAGGDKAKVDEQGGNIIYTTDVEGQERVRGYLEQLRNNRSLVVMQLYIWEVTLNKENGAGINWSQFNLQQIGTKAQNALLSATTGFTSLATSAASPPVGGMSLGATFSGHVDATSVVQFLATQGQVQTISNPQLTFVSGSGAEFKVGGQKYYISQVGQSTSSTVSGSSASNNSIGTSSVQTASLDKGLSVTIGGAYESGVISAVLELALEDVVSLNPTTTQGITIDLPETTQRKLSTSLRVRPGDNLVLAGMVSSKDTNDRQGIPIPFGGHLPTYNDDQLQNSELVIMVKPSVVLFADAGKNDPSKTKKKPVPAKAAAPAPAVALETDAVVIDKDGAKPMDLSDVVLLKNETEQPTSLQPQATAPEDATPSEASLEPHVRIGGEPAKPTPDAGQDLGKMPSKDGAMVDQQLLQRGFSHAFDGLKDDSAKGDDP